MRKKIKQGILSMIVVMAMVLSFVQMSTFAATQNVTVNFTQGAFTISALSLTNFGDAVLTGNDQTLNSTIDAFTIKDARGSGSAWHVSVSATQLTSASGKKLHTGSLTANAPGTISAVGHSSATSFTTSGGTLDDAIGTSIISASLNGGMGTYNVSNIPLALNVYPSEAFAELYTSTITVNLVTGP